MVPGPARSTTANAFADRLNWSVIDTDTLRKDLRGVDHDDHDVAAHPDLYDEATTAETYATLLGHAELLLIGGESVVIDATWSDAAHRDAARAVAARHGAEIDEFECRLDAGGRTSPDRRSHRPRSDDASDATPELVDRVARDPWPQAASTRHRALL